MLRAVVTQVGDAFTVHLTSVPPTTPEADTNTTEAEAEGTTEGTTGEAGAEEEHHGDVEETEDGLVAHDGVVHVGEEEAAAGPNPIVPEIKEVLWGAGAFIVFALIMRYLAFPRLKRGMDARYAGIRTDHEQADAMRAAAQAEVADYQAQLAGVKAEAAARLDQVRQRLEADRATRVAAVNAEIAEQRAAATSENEAARRAVQDQIQAAVADVAASAIRLAVGRPPDPALVQRVVNDVMGAEVAR